MILRLCIAFAAAFVHCVGLLGYVVCNHKIGKKGVFLVIDKFWKGRDEQIEKNACRNAYLRSIFMPEKYVFRVCFESPNTRMISSLKYKWPPRRILEL